MSATGIIRRVDELGRVVLPKEVRTTLSIREGDPLEIFMSSADQEIVLRKYDEKKAPLGAFRELLDAVNDFVPAKQRAECVALLNAAKRLMVGGAP